MEYLTGKEISGKWGVTDRMVNYYCSARRIDGALKKVIYGLYLLMLKNRLTCCK